MIRYPTDEEYASYDGMHCNVKWSRLSHDWQCPVCNRNKRQILQWGKRVGSNALRYGSIGWKAGLHTHHDHGADIGRERFSPTLLCGACNYLDARLKRKAGVTGEFSFSPSEMRECLILARPNEKIRDCDIDFDRAKSIYSALSLIRASAKDRILPFSPAL
ncbi:hypothetical protein J2X05_000550 [Cellvibrio fibrivorans]|uniref:HNH endonuclease n=1 Tax=Cellvibrio fibrivorans TaxID=126350 RepID=A0ABU1UTN8_9GAMM|nr:hypothetical protein [Cellvibrio fibrivorans]